MRRPTSYQLLSEASTLTTNAGPAEVFTRPAKAAAPSAVVSCPTSTRQSAVLPSRTTRRADPKRSSISFRRWSAFARSLNAPTCTAKYPSGTLSGSAITRIRTFAVPGPSIWISRAAAREVDDTAVHERPAVVDAHAHREIVREIAHLDYRSERHRAMRGGELLHIVDFAVRSPSPVIRIPVPARDPHLFVADMRHRGGRAGRGCGRWHAFFLRATREKCQHHNRERAPAMTTVHLSRS